MFSSELQNFHLAYEAASTEPNNNCGKVPSVLADGLHVSFGFKTGCLHRPIVPKA